MYEFFSEAIKYYDKAMEYCEDNSDKEKLNEYIIKANNFLHDFEQRKSEDITNKYVIFQGGLTFFRNRGSVTANDQKNLFYKLEFQETDEKWYKEKFAVQGKNGEIRVLSPDERGKAKKLADTGRLDAFVVTSNSEMFVSNAGHYELYLALCDIENRDIISEPFKNRTALLYAGCIAYKKGEVELWNNSSGHFLPYSSEARIISNRPKLPFVKFYSHKFLQDSLNRLYVKFNGFKNEIAKGRRMPKRKMINPT